MNKTLLAICLLSAPLAWADLNNRGESVNPFTNEKMKIGNVGLPKGAYHKVPDNLNFDNLNDRRECSPAERYAGKTECYRCDADVPHRIVSFSPSPAMEKLMKEKGGMFVYGEKEAKRLQESKELEDGYKGTYSGAWDYKPYTGEAPEFEITPNPPPKYCYDRNKKEEYQCGYEPVFAWFKGYNLQGQDSDLAPLNNRTICEVARPQGGVEEGENPKDSWRGAKALGIAGLTIGAGLIAKGKSWEDLPLFSSKGGQGSGDGGLLGKGGNITTFLPTEMFACLEYFTGTNPSRCGGDHLSQNQEGKRAYCQEPMRIFYATKMAEMWCHGAPCDGVADGAFKPATIAMRKLLLMTNPFYTIGRTPFETDRIVNNRPMTCSF